MESAEELGMYYKIRKTVLQMLEDRKYKVLQSEINQDFETFKSNYRNKSDMNFLVQKENDEKEFLYVEFAESKKLGVGDINNFVEKLSSQNIKNGLLIIKDSITSLAKVVIYNNINTVTIIIENS